MLFILIVLKYVIVTQFIWSLLKCQSVDPGTSINLRKIILCQACSNIYAHVRKQKKDEKWIQSIGYFLEQKHIICFHHTPSGLNLLQDNVELYIVYHQSEVDA